MSRYHHQLDIDVSPKDFAWATGKVLRGITLKRKDDGWLVVVRATTKRGSPVVSFASGKVLRKVWANWLDICMDRHGELMWHKDKYANRS